MDDAIVALLKLAPRAVSILQLERALEHVVGLGHVDKLALCEAVGRLMQTGRAATNANHEVYLVGQTVDAHRMGV
jgi:hypothetical protein